MSLQRAVSPLMTLYSIKKQEEICLLSNYKLKLKKIKVSPESIFFHQQILPYSMAKKVYKFYFIINGN